MRAKTLKQHLLDGTYKASRHAHLVSGDPTDPLSLYLKACEREEQIRQQADAKLKNDLDALYAEYAAGATYADLARHHAEKYALSPRVFEGRVARWFKRAGFEVRQRKNRGWKEEVSSSDCIELAKRLGYADAAEQLDISVSALYQRVKQLGAIDQVKHARGRVDKEKVEAAARRLGVSTGTVENMRRDGRLPMAFTDADVERLRLERMRPKPPRARKHRRGNADALYSTVAWRKVRAECLLRDGKKCVRCGTNEKLVAHHIVEAHLCDDPLDLDNLETLCRRCHGKEHAYRAKSAA